MNAFMRWEAFRGMFHSLQWKQVEYRKTLRNKIMVLVFGRGIIKRIQTVHNLLV